MSTNIIGLIGLMKDKYEKIVDSENKIPAITCHDRKTRNTFRVKRITSINATNLKLSCQTVQMTSKDFPKGIVKTPLKKCNCSLIGITQGQMNQLRGNKKYKSLK